MLASRKLLPAAIAALAIAGCGGSGESSTSTGAQPSGSSSKGATAAKPDSHPAPARPQHPPTNREKTKRPNRASKPAKATQDQLDEIIRQGGGSGVSIDADTPAAKKILKALIQSKGKSHGKKGSTPLEEVVEELVSPDGKTPQGGSGGGQGGGGPGAVAKVLEQLQQE
jgi:hypothetical protein